MHMGNSHNSSKGGDSTDQVQKLVNDAIVQYPVVIFSKTYCPFCTKAKSYIAKEGKSIPGFCPPKVFELDNMGQQGRAIQAHLAQTTGRGTVPNVFIGGTSVGGGDEMQRYSNTGVLSQMLSQALEQFSATDNTTSLDQNQSDVEPVLEHTPVNQTVTSEQLYQDTASGNPRVTETDPDEPHVGEQTLIWSALIWRA